ncbi:hypothetical protein Bca4012_092460 [Brassica carinata]
MFMYPCGLYGGCGVVGWGMNPVKHIGHNWSQVSGPYSLELSCRIEGYMASRDLCVGHGLASLGSEPEKNGGLYQYLVSPNLAARAIGVEGLSFALPVE